MQVYIRHSCMIIHAAYWWNLALFLYTTTRKIRVLIGWVLKCDTHVFKDVRGIFYYIFFSFRVTSEKPVHPVRLSWLLPPAKAVSIFGIQFLWNREKKCVYVGRVSVLKSSTCWESEWSTERKKARFIETCVSKCSQHKNPVTWQQHVVVCC